jgi:hypothetical protein
MKPTVLNPRNPSDLHSWLLRTENPLLGTVRLWMRVKLGFPNKVGFIPHQRKGCVDEGWYGLSEVERFRHGAVFLSPVDVR